MKANFKGRRYKCLVCYDYDLCATCYEAGVTTGRHSTDHPMQCILTRADFGKFDFILQSVRGIPLFYQYTMGLREMNYKFWLIRSISKANNVRMLAAKSVLSQIIPLFFKFCKLCMGLYNLNSKQSSPPPENQAHLTITIFDVLLPVID